MKSNKWDVILNIFLFIASVCFVLCFCWMIYSIKNREKKEDPAKQYRNAFEREIKHKAYGEITDDYLLKKRSYSKPPVGCEDIYRIGEYAHISFMLKVYEAEKNEDKISRNEARKKALKKELLVYEKYGDEIDVILEKTVSGTNKD